MKKIEEIKKKLADDWFKSLQEIMVNQYQLIENEVSKKIKKKLNIFLNESGKKTIKKKVEEFHTS